MESSAPNGSSATGLDGDVSTVTLVIHTGAIGDFILACPSIRALAQDGPVDVLGRLDRVRLAVAGGIARRAYDMTLAGFESLFSEPKAELRAFLAAYDRIVVWMKDDGLIRRRVSDIGVRDVRIHPGLPPEDWGDNASQYYLDSLGLGADPIPRLNIPASPEPHDVILHPGSGSIRKNWPLDRYHALAELLRARGREVHWCMGPAEDDGGVATSLRGDRLLRVDSLVDLGGILRSARAYAGNDSGITHLAAAVGCPTVAIFGPTDPRVWAPRGTRVKIFNTSAWPTPSAIAGAICSEF